MTEPIPGPRGLPILGNIRDIDPVDTIKSLGLLADTYGPIFKLNVAGTEKLFIASQELLNEVCDEKRFEKSVQGTALNQIRNGVEDGLFTAYPGEHNWEVAHRVLMPAFGPLSIRSMFDEMHDIASQLVVKWARFGPKDRINVTDDFTRLTLDSIALCAMDTRFNSFYHENLHPFVEAMVGLLAESGARNQRPAIANYLLRSKQQKYDSDIAYLRSVAQDVLAERRNNPSDKKDLLNAMVKGRDPKTGEGLTDASIINNMITFLIAGHETTSGLLSFLFYNLIKTPAAYQKVRQEVDEVVGKGPVTVEHLSKLPYIEACLRETLRLTPTAPAFSVRPKQGASEDPVIIGGKYRVGKDQVIISLLPKIHRDPAVYGQDAEDFRPERMESEPFSKLPPNSWKPFGNGMRGCIGRPFAWQEALLTVAMLFQNFDFRLADAGYQLSIKQTLTIKPNDLFMHATLRENIDPVQLEKKLHVNTSEVDKAGSRPHGREQANASAKAQKPMTILYGSNSGTCEALSQSLASEASERGYKVRVDALDSAVNAIPTKQPVVIITASYEGQPPDNAAHFVNWLEALGSGEKLKGVNYIVYGCGNHDWVNTYHRIPKLINDCFEKNGATRIANIGLGDVAAGDIFEDFDAWQDKNLWTNLESNTNNNVDTGLDVEIDVDTRRSTLRQDVKEAIVVSNKLLTVPGVPEKRNLTLQLPTGMEYKVGDYLGVLPINHRQTVHRVLKRYGLPWDTVLTIKPGGNTTLPTNRPIAVVDLLGAYVELSQPATRKNLVKVAATIPDEKTRKEVEALTGSSFEKEVTNLRLSVLDFIEKYPSATLSLGDYLSMLPPMRVRQYSICSSPLADPTTASLGWAVLDAPHKSSDEKRHLGVASNYLSALEAHDHVHVAVKPSHGAFHLPSDIENTPIIMACAGTGIAPFRGFVEERAMQKAAGRKLAPAYLFIGCQDPEKDRLFAEEMDKWQDEGVVQLFYAFSKAAEKSKDCRYVQDRLWVEREIVTEVFKNGAKFYVCGSAKVGQGITEVAKKMYQEAAEAVGKPKTDEEVEKWFRDIKGERFASDLFD